jgi:hypothetical protein
MSTSDIRVSDIPLERGRNSNDRNAIIGVAFDPEVLSSARRLYVPPILIAILLEDPLQTKKPVNTRPVRDGNITYRLVGTIMRVITDYYVYTALATPLRPGAGMMLTGVVIITREVDSSTSLAISEAVSVLIHNGNPLGKCPNLIGTSPAAPELNFRIVC